jgi:hypothetical protein
MASEALFRKIALALDGVVEGAHMGHPDFRRNGRIFATLRADGRHGMVKVAPADQRELVHAHPDGFAPENGAWGLQGCTRVTLPAVDEETLGEVLTLAWGYTKNTKNTKGTRGTKGATAE